jgi:hypothetical protein
LLNPFGSLLGPPEIEFGAQCNVGIRRLAAKRSTADRHVDHAIFGKEPETRLGDRPLQWRFTIPQVGIDLFQRMGIKRAAKQVLRTRRLTTFDERHTQASPGCHCSSSRARQPCPYDNHIELDFTVLRLRTVHAWPL